MYCFLVSKQGKANFLSSFTLFRNSLLSVIVNGNFRVDVHFVFFPCAVKEVSLPLFLTLYWETIGTVLGWTEKTMRDYYQGQKRCMSFKMWRDCPKDNSTKSLALSNFACCRHNNLILGNDLFLVILDPISPYHFVCIKQEYKQSSFVSVDQSMEKFVRISILLDMCLW